jgi:sugar phosphate isomerase/epimerase
MRLGAVIRGKPDDPDGWIAIVRAHGYSAASWPLPRPADSATVAAYVGAAESAGVMIAEVGAWSNPISPDDVLRKEGIARSQERLALADEIGARCCVNVSGSRAPRRGPHPDNLTPDTFDLIVETVRDIIDAVRPSRTFYTLETSPWALPDSAGSYLELLEAIDRPQFAVHLDPVNLINSPRRYFRNGDLLRECFAELGPYIKSCHAKDTLLTEESTTHLDEVRPGLGFLDYATLLRELDRLDPDTPLIMEHLPSVEEYAAAAAHIRDVAQETGVTIR